ncbi:BlaI/MecI/CopY family transcriptional regulator [Neorhodopirellula pilleata]|uniref:Transcriptional regulator BlaI n=1 Tax=Neorhodopirellula pilleata TaxID=2714738 RepID=A0A5C6AVL1_9BACT|nr:BlaI/MecI/CopY family transcriptional regulator [Neorhodopirellula pilleata]TWU04065.1 Transcriptional regulator BlaI [Neorhodopirellula pilleata]
MARPNSEHPTELELQILKVLWDAEPMTVRQVRESLANDGRKLAHTTLITMLSTMVDKGQVEKLNPMQGKAFRFSPLIGRDDVSKGMLGDLVERVFDGSAEAVMLSLFDVTQSDETELASLRKLLNKKMREARS